MTKIDRQSFAIFLAIIMLFLMSCQQDSLALWKRNEAKFNQYASEFLSQRNFQEFFVSENKIGFTTNGGDIVDINDSDKTYIRTPFNSEKQYSYNDLNALLKDIKINKDLIFHWVEALHDMRSYLISKTELSGNTVHISAYDTPPFDSVFGFYYIPDEPSNVLIKQNIHYYIKDAIKLSDTWYFGVLKI